MPAMGKKGVVISASMMTAIVATLVSFTSQWEGMDKVARRCTVWP